MLSRDSCQQRDTRNLCGTSGNVFEDLLAPNEPTAACFGNARSLTASHCEPVSVNTRRLAAQEEVFSRNTQNFARKFSTWNPTSHAEEACPQNCMVQQPRNQVSEMHFDKILIPSTFQCSTTSFTTEVCSRSNILTEALL